MGSACGKLSNEVVLPSRADKKVGTEGDNMYAELTSFREVIFRESFKSHEHSLTYEGKVSQVETKEFIEDIAFNRSLQGDTTFKAYSLYKHFFPGDVISINIHCFTEMDCGYFLQSIYIDLTFEKITFADLMLLLQHFRSNGRIRLIGEENTLFKEPLAKLQKH